MNPDDEETFKTYKHIQQVLANNTIEIKKKNIGEKVDKAKVIEETKKDLGTAFLKTPTPSTFLMPSSVLKLLIKQSIMPKLGTCTFQRSKRRNLAMRYTG